MKASVPMNCNFRDYYFFFQIIFENSILQNVSLCVSQKNTCGWNDIRLNKLYIFILLLLLLLYNIFMLIIYYGWTVPLRGANIIWNILVFLFSSFLFIFTSGFQKQENKRCCYEKSTMNDLQVSQMSKKKV